MAKVDLRKMSVRDIIMDMGIIMDSMQLWEIVNDWDILKNFFREKNFNIEDQDMIEYFDRYSSTIDKEKLIYVMLKNIKMLHLDKNVSILKKTENRNTQMYSEILKKYTEALKSSKIEVPTITEKDGVYEIKGFEDINDLMDREKDLKKESNLRKHNLQVLLNVEEKIKMEMFFAIMRLQDFEEMLCPNRANGNLFRNLIIENAREMTHLTINEKTKNGEKVSKEDIDTIYFYSLMEQTREVFVKHIEKFDIEKFLLLGAYRAKSALENNVEDSNTMIEIMQVANENIVNPKLKVQGNIYDGYAGKQAYIKYTQKELSEDVSRIIGTQYFSKKELLETRQLLLDGKMELKLIPDVRAFNLLNLSKSQKLTLINNNPENFEQMVVFDAFSQDEIKEALEHIGDLKISTPILQKLYDNADIEKRDILKLYMRNNMDLAKTLDMDVMYDLKPEITVEELMKYYAKMKENEQTAKDFNRYSLLFRELKMKGKTLEEQANMAEQIMEELYKTESDYDEDLKSLYQFDLLPIQSLIDWNGEDMVYDLIQNASLKPRDAKDLLVNDELDLGKVYDALRNSKISETEKMSFIYSSFDGIGKTEEEVNKQNEARNYLIQVIHVSQEAPEYSGNNYPKQARTKSEKKQKRNQYITDPVHRWQLFSVLDEDCSSEIFADGTVIFTLPNVKDGTVVIEKMLKNTKNGNKPDYGVATYIMSQEEFYNARDEIEQGRKINRKKLIRLHEEDKADKIIHSPTWGKKLKENLEITQENNYTQEKIAKIDEIVARIEKARELMD